MNPMTLAWLLIAIILLLFELSSPGLFYFLSFCFGALGGALASWMGFSIVQQVVSASVASLLAFFLLKQWVKHQRERHVKRGYRSNVEALLAQQGFVVESITPEKFGQVKIGGELWAARAHHEDQSIAIGSEVQVVNVRGAHVVVKRIK